MRPLKGFSTHRLTFVKSKLCYVVQGCEGQEVGPTGMSSISGINAKKSTQEILRAKRIVLIGNRFTWSL